MHPESVTVLRELMVLSRLQSPSHYEALSCAVRLLRRDIKEKIPYVALDYEKEVETAKSSSAIKEEGRSEDEAVQLYFQRLTMTTMLRMVVKSRSQKTQGFQNITDKFMELSTNSKIYLLSFVVLLEDQEVNKMMLFIGVM
ncbi:unnamed protein product [Brassica rapa]|uniref:Uncharacterized protein n=1 Tax=Brassica campestris TaxID=3711 RepID=A0A8D9GWH1_BRACM|nr:unnamed protein product [Brassica rapa]